MLSSWRDIRQTANTTDAQLTAKFKKTSLFSTVRDAFEAEDDQKANILPLDEAAVLPTQNELASRWSGYSNEQIAELLRDYQEEKRRLEDMDLLPIVERVKELVLQEMEPQDVDMH
jgi:nuclear pore complex protein Nup133